MNYGENLKRLRNKLGLTQVNFSKKLKVTQVTISSWETNVRHPSPKIVSKILTMAKSKGFEVKYEDLRPE